MTEFLQKTNTSIVLSNPGNQQEVFHRIWKDVIIGSIVNYQPKDVACWINSIRAVGFDGDVIVINFGCPQETIDFLESKGVRIFNAGLNGLHICVQRFYMMHKILSGLNLADYKAVIATDVKDVIFQSNPTFHFRDKYNTPLIFAASENLYYRDEDWGDNNLKVSFPHLYDRFRNNIIYNAGVITGEIQLMADLCLHIYHLSLIGGDPQSDQAAYNVLINTFPFINHTYYCDDDNHWAANLGTTLDPSKKSKYEQWWVDSAPAFDINGIVRNSKNEPYCIVHQYDRVPGLRDIITSKFGKDT